MKNLTAVCAALVLLLSAAPFAAAQGTYSEPILLTSCGQSADVLMMKSLLTRDGFTFSYLPNAAAADVEGKGSVILVAGGSSKGLGAAKISAEDETARVSALVDAAKAAGVPVVMVHLGGLNRRGALSDPFNQLGAHSASQLLVVKGGNDDGFFTQIAEAQGVPMQTVATAYEISGTLKGLYGKGE